MRKMNKWFYAFLGVSVALVIAIVVAIVIGVTAGNAPVMEEGPETGVYYYETESSEYTLQLHSGYQFILNDGVARAGEYTVNGDTITFTFTKESNGSATATLAGDVLTLTYNNAETRYLKKVPYTVSYETNGGSAIESCTVINGKTIGKPNDPTKEGFVFVGWYADEALTKPFAFDSTLILGNTKVYARWIEKSAGQTEYTVSFEGADVADMTTFGGKLYGVPTPKKEGYTFGGWWFSCFEDGEKLTAKYEEDTVFCANTTLYAVWVGDTGSKLAAPLVEVTEAGLSWAAVSGASTYAVKITAPDGTVAFTDNVSATTLNFDFAKAGQYVVEVVAVASNTENNSDTTVRYYNAKALPRVSLFQVIEPSTLLFNGVAGAEKYYITIECGNENHTHTYFNNGKSTVYNFSNCDMKAGGIAFTVTAVADGYASSVSATFTYERKLDKVTDITVDADTEMLVWTPVSGAAYYALELTCSAHDHQTVYVGGNAYALKSCSGDVSVKITPVTKGYLSPEAATYSYKKATLAAPTGITVVGTLISWNEVQNATSYTVKIGSKTFSTEGTSLDLATVDYTLNEGDLVAINVMAVSADKTSVYSDTVSAKYLAFDGPVSYADGYVTWAPAMGTGHYEIKINNGESMFVTDANSCKVTFTQAGAHTISVRFVGLTTSDWVSVDVDVYSITFDSRRGTGVATMYLAVGDRVVLPTDSTCTGYDFDAWYNTPSAAAGNGAPYTDAFYNEHDNVILYANWTPKTYNVTYKVEDGVTGATDGTVLPVTYGKTFSLGQAVSDAGTFLGWYTAPGGAGIRLTDARGDSLAPYTFTDNVNAYPHFAIGILEYIENEDGTYAVTGGTNIGNVIDLVIPDTYNGKPVTLVLENAFRYGRYLKTVSIPNTVTLIGTGAFNYCYDLEAINIREVEGNHKPVYSSYDGALIRDDLGVSYLELFPRAKQGEYTVPATVDSIRNTAFRYAENLKKLTISKEVTYIAEQAFYQCTALEEIVFEAGGTDPLVIEGKAFVNPKSLVSITLPARLAPIDFALFDACTSLSVINAEDNGTNYGSVDGMLTNADKDTILYCPRTRRGALTIPVGITGVGENAFAGRTGLTSITIPNKVTDIAAGAFAGCTNVKAVTFVGGRNTDLTIADGAFSGCRAAVNVTFGSLETDAALDAGTVTIGTSAFENCTSLSNLTFGADANIVAVGDNAFAGCSKISKLAIPATTASIGNSAFAGCSNISNVTFAENGVDVAFGSTVFANCVQIRSVYLPSTVTTFDGSVFDGCDNIVEIVVDPANPALVAEDGVLYNADKTQLLYYPKAKSVDFSLLPTTLTKIGAAAFQNNPKLTSITIPANITEIGDKAFDNCVNLAEVSFAGTGDVKIGAYAFANCPVLTNVELPDAVTEIGDHAFYTSNLGAGDNTVVLPASLKKIGDFAYAYTMISTIEIPANVETVGDGAFSNCKYLATVTVAEGTAPMALGALDDQIGVFYASPLTTVTLADRVTLIGNCAFDSITKLTEVVLSADSNLETIGDRAFYNTRITGIDLPEGLVTINSGAFQKANKITEITIPSTVTSIGKYAFADTKIKTVNFAAADTATVELSINDYAFANNTTMTSITLPKRLTRIYDNVSVGSGIQATSFYTVFDGNTKMTDINVTPGCAAFSSVDGIFYSNDANGNPAELIFCPRAKTGEITVPSTVTLVHNAAFYTTKLERVVFAEMENWNGESTLSLGTAQTAVNGDEPWAVFGTSTTLKEVVLPAHLKFVGSYAFTAITTKVTSGGLEGGFHLTFNREAGPVDFAVRSVYRNYKSGTGGIAGELLLPKVGKIDENAFYYSYYVTKISFAEGSTLTSIGSDAFSACYKLQEVENIPATVTRIGTYGFGNTMALKTMTWEEGSQLRTLDANAFNGIGLDSFVFPETLEVIGNGAFSYAPHLKTVTLNSKMKSLLGAGGEPIFMSCSSLKEVIVPESNPYMTVVNGAVYSADMTTLMLLPEKADITGFEIDPRVTTIEDYALNNFAGTSLTLPEGLVRIGDHSLYSADMTSIVIPASVREIGANAFGYTKFETITFASGSVLETIGQNAFLANKDLTEIDLPDSVTYIGPKAFEQCDALVRVDLPSGITELLYATFNDCDVLEEVIMHEGLLTIEAAFLYCESLETIEIPASVADLITNEFWGGAFQYCSSLKNVIFAEGSQLETIGYETFANCTSLETISLPASLALLDSDIFSGCISLREVELPGTWETLPAGFFAGFDKLTHVVLSDSMTSIGAKAFDGCASLEEVALPDSLETIGEAAFRGCASLTSVYLGDSITEIGNFAFDGCAALASVVFSENGELEALGSDPTVEAAIFRGTTGLTSIQLPATVRTIGANLFQNSGIESIELPAELTAISNYAFSGCTNLTAVSVPETVDSIGNFAFENCSGLVTVEIAFGVESIGSGAFFNCTAMEYVNVPSSVIEIAGNPFINCPSLAVLDFDSSNTDFMFADGALFDADMFTLIYYLPTNEAETYEVPATVREFAAGAFYGSQIKNFIVPDTIVTIPSMLLMDSKKLETVVISNSVTAIESSAFAGCSALAGINIPASVETVGESAFADCTALSEVTFTDRNKALTFGARAFEGCTALTEIDLPEEVTAFAPYMFANTGIVSFTVPGSITDASAEGVFANCASLTTFVFHDGVVGTLGNKFFKNCTALENLTLSSGINMLGELKYAGMDSDGDGEPDYPSSYRTNIPSETFYGCESLVSIDLSNVEVVGAYAFYGCSSLQEITFPGEISVIGDYAFAACTSLVNVDMSGIYGVVANDYWLELHIGKYVFQNCTALEEVYFPMGYVTEISEGIFEGCTALTYVEIYDLFQFGPYQAVFGGLTDQTTIYFAWYDAGDLVDYFSYAYWEDEVTYYYTYDNYTWFEETGAIIMGADGWVLLPDGSVVDPAA